MIEEGEVITDDHTMLSLMEDEFTFHIPIFDDLIELRRAVETVPSDVKVHVLDGRYCDFPGNYDVTPGAAEFCDGYDNLVYHRPPDDLLPFGDPKIPISYRDSIHKKAEWMYYDVLPQDQWTVHMDSDERLIYMDRSVFSRLQDDDFLSPRMYIRKGNARNETQTASIETTPRIFKPKFWTFWVDDLAVPRHQCPRGLGSEETKRVYQESNRWEYTRNTRSVVFENLGNTRPEGYLEKRTGQLAAFYEE